MIGEDNLEGGEKKKSREKSSLSRKALGWLLKTKMG